MTNDLAKGQQNVTDIFYKYRVQLKNYIAKRVFSKEDRRYFAECFLSIIKNRYDRKTH